MHSEYVLEHAPSPRSGELDIGYGVIRRFGRDAMKHTCQRCNRFWPGKVNHDVDSCRLAGYETGALETAETCASI